MSRFVNVTTVYIVFEKLTTTLACFKTSLGNFLEILPDKPPTPGYSAEKFKLDNRLVQLRWSADCVMAVKMPTSKPLNRFNR